MTMQGMVTGAEIRTGAGISIGLMLVLAGAWFIWGPRVGLGRFPAGLARARDALSVPTRMTFGLSLMLLGYHAAAWMCPETWLELRVPLSRWWLLMGGVALAVAGSLVSDRLGRSSGRVTDP